MTQPDPFGETAPMRIGSPFALGSETPRVILGNTFDASASPEPIGEGVWRETAAAAGFSAWMLLAFCVVGWYWFPAGGIAISMLGISMSLLGLTSRLLKPSIVALTLHLLALIACYSK